MQQIRASLAGALREVSTGRRLAAVAVLLVALVVQVLLALRWRSGQHGVASLNCGNYLAYQSREDGGIPSCGDAFAAFRQVPGNFTGYMAASSDLFEERLVANSSRPTVLCIGPCFELCAARAALLCWQRFLPRFVVVDPDPEGKGVQLSVHLWLAANAIEQDSVRSIHASVCSDVVTGPEEPSRSCLAPDALLREAQLEPGDVDVLWAADSAAGGPKASEVVDALRSLQGFAPQFVTSSAGTSGAGYEPVLGLPGQTSLIPPALHSRALLPRREQRAQRRARLRGLQGYVGAWVEYAAVALCCLAAAVFVGHRLTAWAVRAQGAAPSLERASAAVLRTAASTAGFSVAASFVGMALRLLARRHLHRELMKHERHEVNTRALALCGAQVFLVALVRAGCRLRRKGSQELVHLAKRALKCLALLALALIVINKVKPVVRKLRVPVAALTAELLKRPKELSCGAFTVPEPELPEECADFMQSHLEGSRPDFEEYLAGLTRTFKNRSPGSPPTLVYVGTGSWLCELQAAYACLAPYTPRVVVVEPNPRALPGLQRRLTQLGLSWPQVTIVRAVVTPSRDAIEALESVVADEGNTSEMLIKNIQSAGFQEFFRGFQGSLFVFSSFETDESAQEPNGNFLRRLPPTVAEDGLWIRAKVWGGSCGQSPTRIEFRVGAASVEHLMDGKTFGWRPIFHVRVIDGKVQRLPTSLWTGGGKGDGWLLAHIADKKNITVFGGSCTNPDWDACNGKPHFRSVSKNSERISLSWRMSAGVNEHKLKCTRRPLVGGSSRQVIPDTAITASSVHANCSLAGSRLDAVGPQASWCPTKKDTRVFVKWDLGSIQDVSILQLRGRVHMHDEGEWVKAFRLYWSLDDASWVSLPGTEQYTGNSDKSTVVEVEFSPPITARYIVLAPLRWHKWPSVRAEFLACDNLQSRFYAFRRGTTRDWTQLPVNFPEVSAMTYKSLLRSHIANFGNARRNPGYTMAEWGKLAETHVEELMARQVRPLELLQEMKVAPSSVDVLSISTRGRGLEVMADFLALQGLRPTVLRAEPDAENFKEKAYDVALSALKQGLQSGGYNYSMRGEELFAMKVEHFSPPSAVAPAPSPPVPAAPADWRPVVRRLARKTMMWLVVVAIGVPLLVVAWRFVATAIQEWQLQAFFSDWKGNLECCSVLKWMWWLFVPSFFLNFVLKGDFGNQIINDSIEFLPLIDGHQAIRNPPAWMSESDCAAPSPACTFASWKGYSEMSRFFREHGDKKLTRGNWRWDHSTNSWTVTDRVHRSTLLRSETFVAFPRLRISITSPAGHTGWGHSIVGKNASDLPRASPTGFVGVAIRDEETDHYLLCKTRSASRLTAPFTVTKQVLTFTEEELAPFIGRRLTLDILDLALGVVVRIHVGEVSFEASCAHKCRRYAERRATRSVTSLENITRSLSGHFAVKAAEGRRPVMVHLGSGTSLCELAEMLPCLSKWSPKHVFIEPNARLLPLLRRRLRELDVPPSTVTILPAAMVPQKSADICSSRRALVQPLNDSAFTAEGSRSEGLPHESRLNGTGWVGLRNTGARPWIKWDLGREEEVFQIKLLGRDPGSGYAHWVTSFTLTYSNDNLNWHRPVKGSFEGNIDRVKAREHVFNPPVRARYVRLKALSWNQWPSLRAELYACEGELLDEDKARSAGWRWSNAVLWTFSPAVAKHWPLLPSSLNELSSLDPRILAAGHREAFTDPDINPGYDQAEWNRMSEAIEPVTVRTTSPLNALADVHVDPKDIDVLSIDARGHNLEILRDLLELPSFRPVYLRFEWDVATNIHDATNDTASEEYLTERLEPMMDALAGMGYRMDTIGPEIVAVKQEVLDFQPLPPAPWVGDRLPTPVDLGIAVFQDHFKPRRWAVPSCTGAGSARMVRVNEKLDLRCCSRTGDACFAPLEALLGPLTWQAAEDMCTTNKLRLCTRQELEQDLCREWCVVGGYVWSDSRAFVLGDEVATNRVGRGWTPAKVIGIKHDKGGQQTYMLEWFDKAQKDQMKKWQELKKIERRRPRSYVLIFIFVATILSLFFRLAKFAWDSERLGHWVDEKLSRFRLTRRVRIVILGLAIGRELAGTWSSELARVIAPLAMCPPSYRGETMVIAFWAMLAFRLTSFVQGGPWLGLRHPEPPYLDPSAPVAWPDDGHTFCATNILQFVKAAVEAPKQDMNFKALEQTLQMSGTRNSYVVARQMMAFEVCRKSFTSFLFNEVFDPDSVMSNLGRLFREKARYGDRPNIIYIGSKDMVCDMRVTYPCLRRFKPRMYLVEPNKRFLPSMLHALGDYGALNRTAKGGDGDAHIVHGALCPEDRKEAAFYAFSPRLLEDFPLLSTTFEELASINRTILESLHRENFDRTDKNPGYSEEEWENMTTYIEEIPTRCWTPVSFLMSIGVWAEAVDILTIDARGYNIRLLQQFLQMDKFWPSYIRFEWDAAANGASVHANDPEEYVKKTLTPLLSALEMRGYRVGTLNHEMVAVHASLGGHEKLADFDESGGAKRTGSLDS